MNDFYLWFSTGLGHISDWQGYDHILFLIALSAVYDLGAWKKLLVLVTAFTIGHSITLALSVLNVFSLPMPYIEFLIPLTILATCLYNLFNLDQKAHQNFHWNYVIALLFGFVHGMGFSFLLKSLLSRQESIVFPLFAFNVGLEAGQVMILAGVLIISLFLSSFTRLRRRDQKLFLSSAVFGVALLMAMERFTGLL